VCRPRAAFFRWGDPVRDGPVPHLSTDLQGSGMKGHQKVIDALNAGLTIELTAINQYFCQAKMCKNWGFSKLAAKHYAE
jgi:hypothetical protein